MGRPGLLEFAIYAVVIAGTASWVYALPPFDHQPSSSQRTEVRSPVTDTSSGLGEQSDVVASSDSGATDEPSQQSTVAGDPASDTESQASQAETSEPDERPRLDPQGNLLVVTARRLNMRSEPNSNSDLVGSYPRGALVEEVSTSGNWVLVRTVEDESMGWMYAGYLGNAAEN